jgi:hypothetical protein
METRRAREIERRRQPLGPTDSRGRQHGRVLILAAGIHPAHDDRKTSGFTPER